jgi:AraC family ethanolamine operon transcriptional activator
VERTSCTNRERAAAHRRQAVEETERYLRGHMHAPVRLSRLCRLVGLSERGLRNAFYAVHGVGPKQWILAERLQGVRRALSEVRSKHVTVTDVATDHGFYELGRFARTYRGAFGETPSDTLRGACREVSSPTKGHDHA